VPQQPGGKQRKAGHYIAGAAFSEDNYPEYGMVSSLVYHEEWAFLTGGTIPTHSPTATRAIIPARYLPYLVIAPQYNVKLTNSLI
jgi:hypothetical protein